MLFQESKRKKNKKAAKFKLKYKEVEEVKWVVMEKLSEMLEMVDKCKYIIVIRCSMYLLYLI